MFVGTFFVFRNSVEKLCVSWVLSLVECVAVWAPKLPVPHTDVLKPTSHKVFLRNYWNPNKPTKTVVPPFLHLFGDVFILFLFHHSSASLPPSISPVSSSLPKEKSKKKSPEKLYLQLKYPAFEGFLFIFQLTATESTIFARPNLLVPCLYFHLRFLSGARLSPSPLPHD